MSKLDYDMQLPTQFTFLFIPRNSTQKAQEDEVRLALLNILRRVVNLALQRAWEWHPMQQAIEALGGRKCAPDSWGWWCLS